MSEPAGGGEREPAGADLVIPALALAFAGYFFFSIADLAWEAKANGVLIGSALVLLIVIQLVRIAMSVTGKRADLSFAPLLEPRDVFMPRVWLVIITVLFIATLKWLGVTLGIFLALAASLWVLGIRRPKIVFLVPFVTAAAVYVLFIAILDSSFPHGPVENLVTWLVGLAA